MAIAVEPSGEQSHFEWLERFGEFHDDLARCAGRSPQDAQNESLETRSDRGFGWRRWLVQPQGITVIVTDDPASYKIVAEKLQRGHQICQFHVRRGVGKALQA